MRRHAHDLVIGITSFLALTSAAHANGRPPNTSTINFRQGNEQHIAAGLTFGVVFSHNGGTTWEWMCEKAVKYGGMYDPDYAYSQSGALFATTFEGLLVNRNGCTFDLTPQNKKFFATVTFGPDHALYLAAAEAADPNTGNPGDATIYRSNDDGATFPVSASPGMIGDWWNSLEVAPSDANRVYLSGFRLAAGTRTLLMFRSTDGGASYAPMTTSTFVASLNSPIDVVGIASTNPDMLYARVGQQNGTIGDAVYRSPDAGQTWTKIFEKPDQISFVVRPNGDLVAGTPTSGAFISRSPSNGDAWEPLANAPHISCLAQNTAGEVWACTQNFAAMANPGDGAGIMKSTDLVTWTKVLAYQDIAAPVACAVGTEQRDLCIDEAPSQWCGLRNQLGVTANPTNCVAPPVDGVPDAGVIVEKSGGGCCDSGSSAPASLGGGLLIGLTLLRRRATRGRRIRS